jgi:hypothetical protein
VPSERPNQARSAESRFCILLSRRVALLPALEQADAHGLAGRDKLALLLVAHCYTRTVHHVAHPQLPGLLVLEVPPVFEVAL